MRRPAHGATCKPGPCRPASGFGQPVGRPGPRVPVAVRGPIEPEALVEAAGAPEPIPPRPSTLR
jgi:hypothetical protein